MGSGLPMKDRGRRVSRLREESPFFFEKKKNDPVKSKDTDEVINSPKIKSSATGRFF